MRTSDPPIGSAKTRIAPPGSNYAQKKATDWRPSWASWSLQEEEEVLKINSICLATPRRYILLRIKSALGPYKL